MPSILSPWGRSDEAFGFDAADTHSQTIDCPRLPSHRRGGARLAAVELPDFTGQSNADVYWVPSGDSFVVKERLVGLVRSPCTIVRPLVAPRGWRWEPLYDVQVVRWYAPPQSAGVRATSEPCPACGLREYGSYPATCEGLFEANSWPDSDYFLVWPFPTRIFISDRMKEQWRKAKVRGVDLLPLSEESPAFAPKNRVGPVRDWDPDDAYGLRAAVVAAGYDPD